jgi:hypothetical protein
VGLVQSGLHAHDSFLGVSTQSKAQVGKVLRVTTVLLPFVIQAPPWAIGRVLTSPSFCMSGLPSGVDVGGERSGGVPYVGDAWQHTCAIAAE